jgi:hypothetical protein
MLTMERLHGLVKTWVFIWHHCKSTEAHWISPYWSLVQHNIQKRTRNSWHEVNIRATADFSLFFSNAPLHCTALHCTALHCTYWKFILVVIFHLWDSNQYNFVHNLHRRKYGSSLNQPLLIVGAAQHSKAHAQQLTWGKHTRNSWFFVIFFWCPTSTSWP